MKPTHTPTAAPSSTPKHPTLPWEVGDDGYISDGDMCIVCQLWDAFVNGENVTQANAAFIVRAVNSHQALIDALEHALLWCPSSHPDAEMYRNALKTAKGE